MANVKLVFGEKETKAPVSSQNTSSKVRLTFAGGQPTKETASSTNTSRPLNLAQTQAAQKAAVVQERDVGVRQSQYDREMARLENLRRPAAVDLDMTTLNRVNDQMKAMRAAAGKQEDPDFLTRIVSTAKGTAERQLAGHAGTVETLLTGLGKLGSFLQDKKDAKQAAQDREYLAQHEKELAEALAAGDEEAAKWAQIKINQAKYRLKTNGDLGDYYDSVTEKAIADVDAYGDKMYAAAEEDFSTAKQGANAIGRLAVDAGSAVSDFAADAVGNFILPGLGTIGRISRTFGHGSEAAQSKDLGFGRQLAYGATSAAVGEGINRLFSGNPILEKATGRGALDDILIPFLGNTAGGRTLRSGIGEAIEGGAEGIIDIGAQKIILGDKADQKTVKDVGYDALIGFLVGDITGGLSGIGNAMARRQTDPLTREYAAQTDPLTREYLRQTQSAPQGPAVPAAGQKNTASTNRGEAAEVVKVLADNIPILQTKEPVATTSANVFREIQGNTMAEKARKLFQDIKGIVTREGFGAIEINGRSVKDDLSHGVGPAKVATISVVPQVIQHGEQIDFQQNWKGRGYDGYTFAAPIVMDGEPVYVAAVVKKTSKNRFYLHEVVDSNGNIIKIDDEESANPTSLATNGDAGTQSPSPVEGMHPLNVNPTISHPADSVNMNPPAQGAELPGTSPDGIDDGLGAANAGSLNSDYDNLQAQSSSFYPEGANAARPVDVPTRDFEGQNISKSASTVMGAQALPDDVIPMIEQMVADGRLSYNRRSDQSAIDQARRSLENKGFAGALEQFRNDVTSGKASKDTVVLGQTLLNNAANARDGQAVAEILSLYQSLNTNIGQAMQAASILRKLSPESQLYGVQRSVENMRAALEKRNRRNHVADIKIDDALVQKFLDQTDQAGRDAVMRDIYQNVADQVPSNWRDKWNAWRYLSMLGNPRTHIRNIIGNAGFQPVRAIKNEIAAGLEAALSGLGVDVERTKSFAVSPALYRAAWNDYSNAADFLSGSKYDDVRGEIQSRRRIFKTGALEAARKGNSAALEWEDAIFKRITYADSLAGYLKANGVTAAELEQATAEAGASKVANASNVYVIPDGTRVKARDRDNIGTVRAFDPTSGKYTVFFQNEAGHSATVQLPAEIISPLKPIPRKIRHEDGTPFSTNEILQNARDYAAQEALKATYQDNSAIAQRTQKIVDSFGVVGEAVMPFKKTPANILSRALEYSPAGLAKSLTLDLRKVQKGDMSVSQALDNVAAGLTGSALFALGAYLFAQGLVTGGQGDSEDDKWAELLGHQGYALELEDGTSITLDWLAPESLPFFMGVEMMSAVGENGWDASSIVNSIWDATKSAANPMLELSMMQGVNDLIESVQYAEEKPLMAMIPSVITSYFSQGIPTLLGQVERSGEDVRMTTYTDKNAGLNPDAQYALGRASSRLPLWDYNQIPYIDAWGREEETGDLGWRLLNNAANPAYISQVEVDKVESELQRLRDATGETSVFPDLAARYITDKDGNRKDLTAEEYVKYAKDLGNSSYKLIQEATSLPAYKAMSDTDKVEYIGDLYAYADAAARAKIGGKPLEGWQLNVQKAQKEQGISPAEFCLYRNATSDLKADKDANGESISGSKKEKVIAAINDMDFFSRTEKDWVYLLSYHGEDAQKDLRKAPWNQ